ncbi:MAG: ABC transporter ATP-binding protein [Thermotogae bacterium]|nr:ABC transporter ATP-binding protein [Thermotogota bacterium]
MEKNEYYVEVKDLVKEFRDPSGSAVLAVDGVSFGVRKGEMVTLLGPSGCGKTTTLRLIGGFEIPTAGRVYIDGVDVTDYPPNRRPTGMVFQSYALFPHMTVFDNIAYGLRNKRLSQSEVEKKVYEILEIVNLHGLEKRYPGQLSGGQQQRVALARSLVVEPKVLLLDEPLSNLDAKLREQMRVELKKIQKKIGITGIYVTHDQLEAMTLSDRVIVMKDGKIVQMDTPEALYRFPANKFVANFIGKANFIEGRISSVQDNSCEVVLPNGRKARIELRDARKFGVDELVLVVMRPEGIEFSDSKEGLLAGEVITRIYTGAMSSFEVKVEGEIFTVDVQNPNFDELPDVGDKVWLSVDRKAITIVRRE